VKPVLQHGHRHTDMMDPRDPSLGGKGLEVLQGHGMTQTRDIILYFFSVLLGVPEMVVDQDEARS